MAKGVLFNLEKERLKEDVFIIDGQMDRWIDG